jgi:dethiobiotin synthetase
VRGCFVTGTDTGVGKTVVAAAIVATLHSRGVAVRALKPVVTGLDQPTRPDWPHDHELLARVAGSSPLQTTVFTYGPAVSPHLAEKMTQRQLDPETIRVAVRRAQQDDDVLVVEGVGGLLVPLTEGYDVRALARDVDLPLVIAARATIGTINHTLLTLEAARTANLSVAGVVLTPWPEAPSLLELSNRDTIAELGRVPVATLPYIDRPTPELLATAGGLLPLDEWIA